MSKPKFGGIKVKMWDNTSTAPKDKDGNPVMFIEFNVRHNVAYMVGKTKKNNIEVVDDFGE